MWKSSTPCTWTLLWPLRTCTSNVVWCSEPASCVCCLNNNCSVPLQRSDIFNSDLSPVAVQLCWQIVRPKSQAPYWRGFDYLVWQGFVLFSNFPMHYLTVFTQPPYAIKCIVCVHVNNPKRWHPYHNVDSRQYCTLGRMGSAAHVCTLTILNAGTHTIMLTHDNTAHWEEWVALLMQLL